MFWKRTSPPPTMMIFDAPMRESCVVKRSRTNTPTQALVTLNETGFVEAARKMAERVYRAKADDSARMSFAFRMATGREANAAEKSLLSKLLADQRAQFAADGARASKLLAIGDSKRDESLPAADIAAWTLICNALLNLDEVLTLH